jgi:hypothetical protein
MLTIQREQSDLSILCRLIQDWKNEPNSNGQHCMSMNK